MEEKEVKVYEPITAEKAKELWDKYQQIKSALVSDEDKQLIKGKVFYTKSYWRKLATVLGISTEIVTEEHEVIEKNFISHFTIKAIAPNGRYAVGAGSCDTSEKVGKGIPATIHNIRSTAETRAFNRAVSNLVAGGEVSAEEMIDESPQKETNELVCSNKKCNAEVSEGVAEFSKNEFGKILCMNCQKTERKVKK